MKKKYLIFISIMTIFFFISCGSDDKTDSGSSASYSQEENNSIFAVEVLTVSRGKLLTEVTGSGIIRGAEEAWAISETSGIIEEVYVSPGDFIREGDPLLKVDDNLAYWAMMRAEKEYETTSFENRGTKSSFENGAVTEIEYKRSQTTWYNSRLNYEQSLKDYKNCTLRAPVSGYVSQMNTFLSRGNLLNMGDQLLKIVNRDHYILEIFPGQSEIGLIHVDTPVSIYVDLVDRTLESSGTVIDISGGSNESTGSFPVRISWKNKWEEQILPGMTARVEVQTNVAMEGIIIPFDRIIEREGKLWVFLAVSPQDNKTPAIEQGVAQLREVNLGARLGNRVTVNNGLQEGDVLISSGFSSLTPGSPVNLTILGNTGEWQ